MSADFKIGCGSVVFREYELGRVLDAIYAAGYRYFETQATNPWCMHVVVDRDDPVRFADMAKAHGFLGVTSLWTAEGALIPAADSCVDTIKRTIEWAAAANIPIVDLGDGYKPDDMSEDDAFKRLSERLLCLIETAEKYDVTLALEPHGSFSLTADGLERILSISGSKHFGINYDCANIRRAGFVETRDGATAWRSIAEDDNNIQSAAGNTIQSPAGNAVQSAADTNAQSPADNPAEPVETATLRRVVSRVVHFHAKDFDERGSCVPLGQGIVDVAGCILLLREAGYTGAVSLETEGGMPFDESYRLAAASHEFLMVNLT